MDLRALRYFVAVTEERHFGRAAARLHITQPPLSRAVKQLENELGVVLLHRSSGGVVPTTAGTALFDEARALLAQAEHVRARIAAIAGTATLTVGTLADSAEQIGTRLAAAFRRRHPDVDVRIREADLADPTTGLRAGLVDVAITRTPFDDDGISTHVLHADPVGVVLRTDDPLARCGELSLPDLAGRRWIQLPDDTDPAWRAYWNGATGTGLDHDGPVVRTIQECVQAVVWNGTIAMAPLRQALPDALVCVPLADVAASRLVVAWNSADDNPLIRSFVHIAADAYRADAEQGGAAERPRRAGRPRGVRSGP